jgi:hypothetical protein
MKNQDEILSKHTGNGAERNVFARDIYVLTKFVSAKMHGNGLAMKSKTLFCAVGLNTAHLIKYIVL